MFIENYGDRHKIRIFVTVTSEIELVEIIISAAERSGRR